MGLQFAQGAASEALGYESGTQTKEAGLEEMREAKVSYGLCAAQSRC